MSAVHNLAFLKLSLPWQYYTYVSFLLFVFSTFPGCAARQAFPPSSHPPGTWLQKAVNFYGSNLSLVWSGTVLLKLQQLKICLTVLYSRYCKYSKRKYVTGAAIIPVVPFVYFWVYNRLWWYPFFSLTLVRGWGDLKKSWRNHGNVLHHHTNYARLSCLCKNGKYNCSWFYFGPRCFCSSESFIILLYLRHFPIS